MTRPRGIFCIHPSARTASLPGPGPFRCESGRGWEGSASAQWIFVRNLGHYHKMYSSNAAMKNEIALSHKQPVTKWAKTNFPWWSPDSSRTVKNLESKNNIWWSREETDPLQAAVPNPEIRRLLGRCELMMRIAGLDLFYIYSMRLCWGETSGRGFVRHESRNLLGLQGVTTPLLEDLHITLQWVMRGAPG